MLRYAGAIALALGVAAVGCPGTTDQAPPRDTNAIAEATPSQDDGAPPPGDGVAPADDGAPPRDGAAGDAGGSADGPLACAPGSACDDGDPCTTGDRCEGGICAGQPAADGTQCGAQPKDRCCNRVCVSIATDEKNCGGCGLRCAPGYRCQGVATTTSCPNKPDFTSGRCLCANGNNALCPSGQTCRQQQPVADHCSPKDAAQCAPGEQVQWNSECPNYCYY